MIMPDSAMMPRMATKPSGLRVNCKAMMEPIRPSGAVMAARIMSLILPSWNMRTMRITKIMTGMTTTMECTDV